MPSNTSPEVLRQLIRNVLLEATQQQSLETVLQQMSQAEPKPFALLTALREDPRFSYVGEGQFREVFSTILDKTVVVKVANTNRAYVMQQDDWRAGIRPDFADLFPKAFAHDPQWQWIVVEKVEPLSEQGDPWRRFSEFFPHSPIGLIDQSNVSAWRGCLLWWAGKIHRNIRMVEVGQTTFRAWSPYDKDDIVQMTNDFAQDKQFRRLGHAVGRLSVSPGDLSPVNLGTTTLGRLVILDTSVRIRGGAESELRENAT